MLQLSDLECHFNWKPVENSTKHDYDYVIEKMQEKMIRHPEGIVAYQCTLAYLHTVGPVVDYQRSLDELKKLLDERNPLKVLPDFQCEFLIRANILLLRIKCDGLQAEGNEVQNELSQLSTLWEEPKTQMMVYSMKGSTLNCFVPTKYDMASDAYDEAISLPIMPQCSVHQRFDLLWGSAFIKARMMRLVPETQPTDYDKQLWKDASKLLDEAPKKGINTNAALFYAQYADAIISDEKLSKELLYESMTKMETLETIQNDTEFSHYCSATLLVCIRVLRKLFKKFTETKAIDRLTFSRGILIALGKKVLTQKSEFHHQLSLTYSYSDPEQNKEAIMMLSEAKKCKDGQKHLDIDLQLLRRQWGSDETFDKVWAMRKYKSLEDSYNVGTRNKANIELHRSKSIFYRLIQPVLISDSVSAPMSNPDVLMELDFCMKDLLSIKTLYPSEPIAPSYLNDLLTFFRKTMMRPEYEAWCLENMRNQYDVTEVRRLYTSAIEDAQIADERKYFARFHLGKHFMDDQMYQDAIDCLGSVPSTYEQRDRLLSDCLVFHSINRSIDEMNQCISLGNCNAIPLMLARLEEKKRITVISDVLIQKRPPWENDFFFSSNNFQVCSSLIDLMKQRNQLDDEFREEMGSRIKKFLGISFHGASDPQEPWRLHRLKLTELKNRSPVDPTEISCEVWNVLKESRYELDRIMKKLRKDSVSGMGAPSYPRILKCDRMTTEELIETLKEMSKWTLQQVKKVILTGLKVVKISRYGDQISKAIDFLAKSEHHIITQEGAWQLIWISQINLGKHQERWDLGKFLELIGRAKRELLQTSFDATSTDAAIEMAHTVAEYVEQRIAVFEAFSDDRL